MADDKDNAKLDQMVEDARAGIVRHPHTDGSQHDEHDDRPQQINVTVERPHSNVGGWVSAIFFILCVGLVLLFL